MKKTNQLVYGYILLALFLIFLASSVSVSLKEIMTFRISVGEMLIDCLISLLRVLLPILTAQITGIILGYLIFQWFPLKRVLLPLINFFRHISPFAWLPFSIIWFGLGEYPIFFVMFITLFFPITIAAEEIFSRINPEIREEAEVAGASRFQLFSRIYLPLSFPSLLNLFRIMWSLGWTSLIAAEMLGVSRGLGFRLLEFRYLMQYDRMFYYLLILGFIGISSDLLIRTWMKYVNITIFD